MRERFSPPQAPSSARRPRAYLRAVGLVALLTVALSACTIYVRPGASVDVGVSLNDVILSFQPTRGDGATYYVGDTIEFAIRTSESGYVSLTAMDPDGSVYVFARNVYVPGNRTVLLPTPEMNVTFSAGPPTGYHRVRASFTSGRTDTTRVTYRGRSGNGAWTSAIELDIRGYPVKDVAETSLVIR